MLSQCVLIGHCAGHSNYRPTGNRQAQHVPCDISYNSRLISVVWPLWNIN